MHATGEIAVELLIGPSALFLSHNSERTMLLAKKKVIETFANWTMNGAITFT
jgi:hypothetical protein